MAIIENYISQNSVQITDQKIKWDKIKDKLRQKIPAQFFSVFFEPLFPEMYSPDLLILSASDIRISNHINKRYQKELSSAAKELFGSQFKIEVKSDALKKIQLDNIEDLKLSEINQINYNKAQSPGSKDHISAVPLNQNYTFGRFVKGPSNEHAIAAALGAAQNPHSFRNPLYLYGGVGLGKTHLMMAIGNYINHNSPWMKVQYVPAEVFQNDLVQASVSGTMEGFRARYRNVDVLLIDDIQFIRQRAESTQEQIFHTFNYLYQNKKQIVISGDRPPAQLATLADRLISRFVSGLIVDIKPPNYETRLAILKQKSEDINLEVPDEVLRLIAARMKNQVRLLEAALIKLQFISEIENHPIDRQMANLVS